ncbi:hypothetical protein EYE40_07120 [Glaciihabitans arcticus]|uniref:Uncharacterized protein n=1 Tax=Glaciihabitans arcticus TaxID=2668039 RepID=A0A4Q9GVG2_9MICO|nr:hypothetical protein [Glaciihabitans arcticus]TBN57187.1 hypothetical protein EYE40_07120 [Glaciihabitans arcticus]
MDLSFEVGDKEFHDVLFQFDKVWGGLNIYVDGESIIKTVRFASLSLVKTWEFEVGETEKHKVKIEKHRALMFAGFRPQPVHAFVDGKHVASGIA